MHSENIKKEMSKRYLKKHGYECSFKNPEVQRKIKQKYIYDNNKFDSAPEIAFYIWLKDNDVDFTYMPNEVLYYEFNGKAYFYMPDFKVGNEYVELKGDQFFTENGKMCNPYDHSQDERYEAKHQCMLKNNVKILKTTDYMKYIDYVKSKYGKRYLKTLKSDFHKVDMTYVPVNNDLKHDLELFIATNPIHFSPLLKRHRTPRTNALHNYINDCIAENPKMKDLPLRVACYWIVNDIKTAPRCSNCGKELGPDSFMNIKAGYHLNCSMLCARQSEHAK